MAEQTRFETNMQRLDAVRADQKAALEALGRTPSNVWSTYPEELRAVSGSSAGTMQAAKTVAPDPAGMEILPDDGYGAMLKVILAAEPNFQPWNIAAGIHIWGKTGTAKPAASAEWPFDDEDIPSEEDFDGEAEKDDPDVPKKDMFVLADDQGNITKAYLYGDEFEITFYDPATTEFKAKGWRRVSWHTTGENAGTYTRDNFRTEESGGWNYLKNIRSCTREKLYYQGIEIWPNNQYYGYRGVKTYSYNGVVLPTIFDGIALGMDVTGLPYRVISKKTADDGTVTYKFWCTSAKPYLRHVVPTMIYDPYDVIAAPLDTTEDYDCYVDGTTTGDVWEVESKSASTVMSDYITFGKEYEFVWSNTDIYDESGNLVHSASVPVAVDLRTDISKLNALPVWNQSIYPYAYVTYGVETGGISLAVYTDRKYSVWMSGTGIESDTDYGDLNIDGYKSIYRYIDGAWSLYAEHVEEDMTATSFRYLSIHLWSNVDITNGDGRIYFKAPGAFNVYV